jgi:hypothetical protein
LGSQPISNGADVGYHAEDGSAGGRGPLDAEWFIEEVAAKIVRL